MVLAVRAATQCSFSQPASGQQDDYLCVRVANGRRHGPSLRCSTVAVSAAGTPGRRRYVIANRDARD